MAEFIIRAITPNDEPLIARLLEALWGSRQIVTKGIAHDASKLPGFLASRDESVVGLLTFRCDGTDCEIMTLDAFVAGEGIGSALFREVRNEARARGCSRLWLITTNDNVAAMAFYQRRGMRIAAVYIDAVTAARELKPQIPLIAENGILIRDEIEFQEWLDEPSRDN